MQNLKKETSENMVVSGIRFALPTGETLTVRTWDGEKVFVDQSQPPVVVLLQPFRRAYLQDLPSPIRAAFGVGNYAPATYLCPNHEGRRFTFDVPVRRSVAVDSLPDGQIVHVLPDAETAGVRVPLPLVPGVLYARAAVAVGI